jgi:hypothetical protein
MSELVDRWRTVDRRRSTRHAPCSRPTRLKSQPAPMIADPRQVPRRDAAGEQGRYRAMDTEVEEFLLWFAASTASPMADINITMPAAAGCPSATSSPPCAPSTPA